MGKERVRTTIEYIAKAKNKWNGYFTYPNTIFIGRFGKIEFECPVHGAMTMTARAHLDSGCNKCNGYFKHTGATAKAKMLQIHGYFCDYSKIPDELEFGVNTIVEIGCPKHGFFKIKIEDHFNAVHPCRSCANEARGIANKKTTEEWISEAKLKWGQTCNYDKSVYVNKETYIDIYCIYHGWIKQKPNNHVENGCHHCSGRGIGKHDRYSFIKRAIQINGYIYDYSKVLDNFSGLNSVIELGCPTHGWFKVVAANHLTEGRGCSKCNGGVFYTHNDFLEKANKKHNNKFKYLSKYTRSHDPITIECSKHGVFEQLAYVHLQSIHACQKCAAELGQSAGENEVADYIANLGINIIRNDNTFLGKSKEIDIYLPDQKVGIEYCGLYYHREGMQTYKFNHNIKTNLADEKNIFLIHLFDKEWKEQKEIVKSRISGILGKNKTIYAKNTEIVQLHKYEKDKFLQETHIQGKDNSSIYFGLKYKDQIVSCMTFGHPRFNKNYNWEMLRFSSILYTHIVGGASKLLSHFRKIYPGTIISYADRRWSQGKLYYILGFNLDKVTEPSYHYYNVSTHAFHNRLKFQKYKLKDMPYYDEKLTEEEIMMLNGYDRVWDAGQMRFVLK
jgi:hypothetical protein